MPVLNLTARQGHTLLHAIWKEFKERKRNPDGLDREIIEDCVEITKKLCKNTTGKDWMEYKRQFKKFADGDTF